MNRSFLLMAFFMLLGMSANAQNFKFGATVGLNVNRVAGEAKPHETRLGYRIGGTAIYNFTNSDNCWYASASLLLSQKGFNHQIAWVEENYAYNGHTNITYLQIPIVAGKNWKVAKNFGLFAETGPYIGIGLFGKMKSEEGSKISCSTSKVFSEQMQRRIDCGWALNVGAMVANHVKIGIGYDYGITNLVSHGASTLYNRAATASVSYIF